MIGTCVVPESCQCGSDVHAGWADTTVAVAGSPVADVAVAGIAHTGKLLQAQAPRSWWEALAVSSDGPIDVEVPSSSQAVPSAVVKPREERFSAGCADMLRVEAERVENDEPSVLMGHGTAGEGVVLLLPEERRCTVAVAAAVAYVAREAEAERAEAEIVVATVAMPSRQSLCRVLIDGAAATACAVA
mmetsp:Transcript_59807/g.171561  ORF Transcript_59807/g.171561 Transcript_59807/m.171561 type:complete len:188 (+) Transcript_59807:838-1401(+)